MGIKKWAIRVFGLYGSWKWAKRRMRNGETVFITASNGTLYIRWIPKYNDIDNYSMEVTWSHWESKNWVLLANNHPTMRHLISLKKYNLWRKYDYQNKNKRQTQIEKAVLGNYSKN